MKPPGMLPVAFDPMYEANQPRYIAQINGANYLCTNYEVEFNGHGATDKATIVLPLAGNPDWTQALDVSVESPAPIYVKIYAGFPPVGTAQNTTTGLNVRFWGVLDIYTLELDPQTDSVSFECRSLAAPLISTKITTPLVNQSMTTEQFVQQQATRFGLGLKINTVGNAGTMLDVLASEFVTGVKNLVIWDLMLQCAQYDDVDIWVDRFGVLHYEAPSLISRASIPLKWGRDILHLSGSHATQFSKNIRVEVRSYTKRTRVATISRVSTLGNDGGIQIQQSTRTITSNPIFGTADTVTTSVAPNGTQTTVVSSKEGGPASSTTGVIGESGLERYVFYVKNKTAKQCNDLAQKIWRQISMHEVALSLKIAMTMALLAVMDITAELIVSNTPFKKLNDIYWPRRITEHGDEESGMTWDIEAVNHTLPQGAV